MPPSIEFLIYVSLALMLRGGSRLRWKSAALGVLKVGVTARAFWLLLSVPIATGDGSAASAGQLAVGLAAHAPSLNFWAYCAIAAGIQFVGVLCAMYRWIVLLGAQGIELPVRHIFGSFLIGRFLGVFLPANVGLDAYKLFDAARFTERGVEAAMATFIEKVVGLAALLVSCSIATTIAFAAIGFRGRALPIGAWLVPWMGALIGAGLLFAMAQPKFARTFRKRVDRSTWLGATRDRVVRSLRVYGSRRAVVAQAFGLSVALHMSTGAMFFFAAMAIDSTPASFWSVALAPSLNEFGRGLTWVSGVFEPLNAVASELLTAASDGTAMIAASALGYWLAQALTLAGAYCWWARPVDRTPRYCLVDGRQVEFGKRLDFEMKRRPARVRASSRVPAVEARRRQIDHATGKSRR